MDKILSSLNLVFAKNLNKKIRYNKKGYYIHPNRKKREIFKVTVILPTYNAEKTLEKTLNSIVFQSLGFEHIEVLLIDDGSSDRTRHIILDYAKKYINMIPVFLKENSGTPAKPRNLGIELARGKYIIFIDADDWFDQNGIKVLYDLLEKTKDNYAVGKTIIIKDENITIAGEYASWKKRESINPFSIPRLFYHLGPTARMMNAEFLKNKNIKFPEMKFAEDKQFFIDVLINCDSISTSDEVIYYVNRNSENESLVSKTSPLEKFDANLKVVNYIKQKKLPVHIEKMVLNRFYEIDGITRLFDRPHFLKSNEKEKYYERFSQLIRTTEDLRYDFTENFFHDWHRVLVAFFKNNRFEDIVKIIDWSKNEHFKDYCIIDEKPFFTLPFASPHHIAKINVLVIHKETIKKDEEVFIRFNIYRNQEIDNISFAIRQRNNHLKEIEFPIQQLNNNLYEAVIQLNKLESLEDVPHAVFVKYNGYERATVKMNSRKIIHKNSKKFDFYVTVSDNLGLSVK
ncbi:glycosyltransferase family 2 protein [Pueribacillus theae]|uniref:glycosyltransferase family 2 protein n=1 Tax=Pueribacillus theae TaxID=2171751 RepID=UPI001F0C6012|nr:glycosyltransferase family 2 protein [Pueribacillus theae]